MEDATFQEFFYLVHINFLKHQLSSVFLRPLGVSKPPQIFPQTKYIRKEYIFHDTYTYTVFVQS